MERSLLIIGAGAHGKVVKETADAMGIFGKISFLDDLDYEAIGNLEELDLFKEDFTDGFVALGNNSMRAAWFSKLIQV